MTTINLNGLEAALGLPGPLTQGEVRASRWAGRAPAVQVTGPNVTFPHEAVVRITNGAPSAALELQPTTQEWCYRMTISDRTTGRSIVRYVAVPAGGPVDFGDLQQVDPTTFEPLPAEVSAAWDAALGLAQGAAMAAGASAADAAEAALAADFSAQQAAGHATAAQQSATQAGSSAFAAGTSAAAAQSSEDDARAAATAAAGSASSAAGSAATAEDAATRAEDAAEAVQPFEFVQAGEIGSQTESGLAIWHWDPAITYVPDVPAAFRTALPYKVDFPGLIRVMDASAIVPDFKLVTFVSELSPGLEITASMQMGAPATATWSMVNFGLAEPYTTGLIPISAEQSPGFIGWGTTTARSTATANALMMRDSFGRSKIVDPAAPDDIASKGYVDRIAAVGYTTPIPVSGTQSLASWTQSMVIHWNLLGNVTVSTMPTVLTPGMTISLVLTQDATGGRTLTLPATVKLPSALPLPLTAAAGGVDVVHLWWTGAVWIGALAGRDLR